MLELQCNININDRGVVMKLIDLHCDTVLRFVQSGGGKKLRKNDLCVDIEKLRKADSLAQFFAMYVDLADTERPMNECIDMIDTFYGEIEENSDDIAFAASLAELETNRAKGKISAFLAVEDGGVIEGRMSNLRNLYRLGVRLITLTWNYPNCIGYPNHEWKHKDEGLTAFGKEVIEEMNRLGMIIDVSHLSDRGFYDVGQLSRKPFVASHSDARALTEHNRNLSDDMLKILAEKGGVIGINFESEFLGNGGGIEIIVNHIKHIKRVAGIEAIAVGTDFDGSNPRTELKHIGEMGLLFEALRKEGFSKKEIEYIGYKNALRVIGDALCAKGH
jgi:membrane dipeptidase